MKKIQAKADFDSQTKKFNKYRLTGGCVGTIYIPLNITDQFIEVELDLGSREKTAEK